MERHVVRLDAHFEITEEVMEDTFVIVSLNQLDLSIGREGWQTQDQLLSGFARCDVPSCSASHHAWMSATGCTLLPLLFALFFHFPHSPTGTTCNITGYIIRYSAGYILGLQYLVHHSNFCQHIKRQMESGQGKDMRVH